MDRFWSGVLDGNAHVSECRTDHVWHMGAWAEHLGGPDGGGLRAGPQGTFLHELNRQRLLQLQQVCVCGFDGRVERR